MCFKSIPVLIGCGPQHACAREPKVYGFLEWLNLHILQKGEKFNIVFQEAKDTLKDFHPICPSDNCSQVLIDTSEVIGGDLTLHRFYELINNVEIVALQEIRKYQKSSKNLISQMTFERLVRELLHEHARNSLLDSDYCIQRKSKDFSVSNIGLNCLST